MRVVAAALTFATAAFAGLVVRQNTVPVPQVTYPHDRSTAVWIVGYRHNVTWEAGSVSGNNANIYLAKAGVVDSSHPLASGFSLEAGRVEVVTPSVAPGADYTVLLEIGGSSSSSSPFIINTSKNNLPQNTPPGSGVTTIVFPSTTIVASVTAPVSAPSGASESVSAASDSVSAAVSSLSADASSVAASISAGASSVLSSLSAAQSGASASLSSGLASATGAPESATSGNAATGIHTDLSAVKALVAVGAIALSAGAMLIL